MNRTPNQVYAPDMTKQQLVGHIVGWRENMVDDLNRVQGQSLLDMRVIGPIVDGLVNDVGHLYQIVLEIAKRLPDSEQGARGETAMTAPDETRPTYGECIVCGEPGADRDDGKLHFHQECWEIGVNELFSAGEGEMTDVIRERARTKAKAAREAAREGRSDGGLFRR